MQIAPSPVKPTRILRHINAQRCLRLLRGGSRVSRADMARALGLNRSTTGKAIAELLEAGLVVASEDQAPESEGRKGRPGVRIALAPQGAFALGLDFGSREIEAVLVDLQMRTLQQLAVPSGPDFRDPAAVIARVPALLDALIDTAGVDPSRILGLGVSVPGLVDRDGTVLIAPFLEWRQVDLRQRLAQALPSLGLIEVRNDADCFAVAECANAQPGPSENTLVVLVGEGVGSALVWGGAVMHGAHGHAGEIGHMLMTTPDGRLVNFEEVAGLGALAHWFVVDRPISEGVARLWAQRCEPAAQADLHRWADGLALGLTNAVHLLNPHRIVIGGALSPLYPLVADRVAAFLGHHLLAGLAQPAIELTRFGEDGAVIGAAACIRETVFELPSLEA
jgi:predicted NBD/HSP70 family sugar kinase